MTYIRYVHRVDIYTKSVSANAALQQKATWASSLTAQKCLYVPLYAVIKVEPVQQDLDRITVYLPSTVAINYSDRLTNFTDRKGVVVDSGTYEVMAIQNSPGWSGKIRFHHLLLRKVEEI